MGKNIIVKQTFSFKKSEEQGVLDCKEACILDSMIVKSWAMKLATDSANTVLSVDQIIMSRPAGGPKQPKDNQNWDEDW